MADINNVSDINQNFDTIKTLLNSIRAQGILNTSDVDKLLEGINSKLEKINTEEDVELIKAFLTELKQNLDERHNVVVSKFAAIESLFSNLLKNSSESVKSSEIKELFDIVATNLSVFSREVVSQKESLTDITLRLDAMRSDETQKKDIIKSITSVKNDVEKFNNGFDSIVISLNENFKTVLKTVSEIDQSDAIKGFADKLNNIIDSSNAVLSAIQLFDKKNVQIEDSIARLATQEETSKLQKTVVELAAQSQEINNLVDALLQKTYKIDNLSDKIDAAVNIIVGLKTGIEDKDSDTKNALLNKLESLENSVKEIKSDNEFEEFKHKLETVLNDISQSSIQLKESLASALNGLSSLSENFKALDININLQSLSNNVNKIMSDVEKIGTDVYALNSDTYIQKLTSNAINVGEEIKEKVASEVDKLSQLFDINVTRTLNDISSNAEVLNSRLKDTHVTIANLCEKNFAEVTDSILGLKTIVAQLDDNNVSANNAIFSNITDRLAIFENSLKSSLEKQEDYVSTSSNNLIEQIKNIKNLTENLDYKLDASAIEVNNSKREFENLKNSLDDIIALDFVNVVKDLKVDLYAAKQDLTNAVETSDAELSEKVSNDLFSKYELLISKLDSVEDEIKIVQADALDGLKTVLNSISASIMDVLSYVSVNKETDNESIEARLKDVVDTVNDSNLNYVENVRDIVDVIRAQVETNLKQISEESDGRFSKITSAINESNFSIRQDLKNSFNKLIEVQEKFDSIKDLLGTNSANVSNSIEIALSKASDIKEDFNSKLISLKNALLDKVSEFKDDFTCENADKISEIKFTSENLYSRAVQQSIDLNNDLKIEFNSIIESLRKNISALNENIATTSLNIESANKEVIGYIRNDFADEINNSVDSIKTNTSEVLTELDTKVSDVVNGFTSLESTVSKLSQETHSSLSGILAKILENFNSLQALISSLNAQALEKNLDVTNSLVEDFNTMKSEFIENKDTIDKHLHYQSNLMNEKYLALEALINSLDEQSKKDFQIAVDELNVEFNVLKRKFSEIDSAVDEDLARQISIIEGSFESINLMIVDIMNQTKEALGDKIKQELSGVSSKMTKTMSDELEQYKVLIEDIFNDYKNKNDEQAEFIKLKAIDINNLFTDSINTQNNLIKNNLVEITKTLQSSLEEKVQLASLDYASLKTKLTEFCNNVADSNNILVDSVKDQLDDITKYISSTVDTQAQDVNNVFSNITEQVKTLDLRVNNFNSEYSDKINSISVQLSSLYSDTVANSDERAARIINSLRNAIKDYSENAFEDAGAKVDEVKQILNNSSGLLQNNLETGINDIVREISTLRKFYTEENEKMNHIVSNEIKPELESLKDKIQTMFEENSMNYLTQLSNSNSQFSDEIKSGIKEINVLFDVLNSRLDNDETARVALYQTQISDMSKMFNELIEGSKELTKQEIASVSEVLIKSNKASIEDIEQTVDNKITELLSESANISAGELQTIESFANQILEQIESTKKNSIVCKDLISNLLNEHFEIISNNIEKETDVIVGDILEQFNILKNSQRDEISSLSSAIEDSVAGYLVDSVNDLKSYMDVKTDNSILDSKLDTLRTELEKSFEDTAENINKLLELSVFTDAITDLRTTNEVLINTMADKLNTQVQDFIRENVSKKIDDKFNLFDKNFTDTVVDKYEEVKLLSNQYNKSFEKISSSVNDLISAFADSKEEISSSLKTVLENIDKSVNNLHNSFNDLKAQILNKSLDETFHDAVHKQIAGIEDLVKEQLGYVQDVSELCCANLPELTEMNTIVKYGIQQSIEELKNKLETQDINIPQELNKLKTDLITQFLNIFNQISFVAEQEEIIDFIQEKHSELITILSHIVTTADGIETIKDNVAIVDNKIDSLKEDIDLINEKITAIMSSDGDIDYVYSLHDLESDIANLRLVLNEMKADNKSEEFEQLLVSTNNIYGLVEAIKAELPKFEADEFKKDFENLSEDIVSISTRTNKLLLASDESYKTLQDNLQDFKLVINDLDERTKNFSQEAGIDKIDNKLAVINTMMQNGAKTNQVFNQVFEYLAEWVDKAGIQINTISEKVESLDDLGQIKVMLEDLRAEAHDTTESEELVKTLGDIFDKQAKRISSLEAKLDRMIVDSTINSRNNKIDISPIENTINSFLVAMDDKLSSQQRKITSLENKLEEVVSLVDNKDTAQLTKKVGGMDRQLAKLNKSIEKIASNVVEK